METSLVTRTPQCQLRKGRYEITFISYQFLAVDVVVAVNATHTAAATATSFVVVVVGVVGVVDVGGVVVRARGFCCIWM